MKRLDGKKETYNVEEKWKVDDLKQQLAESTGIYKESIRLVFKGSALKDEKTLAESKVKAGDTIHMIMQLKGGCCPICI